MIDLVSELTILGASVEELERKAAAAAFQIWCTSFVSEVKRTKGTYRYRGFHWHAFSYGLVPSLSREDAEAAYADTRERELFVIPESYRDAVPVRCSGVSSPYLKSLWRDLYVFPESGDWTMVFTHEREFGPYVRGAAAEKDGRFSATAELTLHGR